MGCHITTYIVNEHSKIYSDKISNETIRKILVDRKKRLYENYNHHTFTNEIANNTFIEKSEYQLILYSAERLLAENINNLFIRICTFLGSVLPCSEENSWKNEIHTASKIDENSKHSPHLPVSCDDSFPMVKNMRHGILSCHHIGILLTRIFIDFISENLGTISNIVRQWTAMILNGCQNIEQGQGLDYSAFELLIGRQKTSANKQRDELKNIAGSENSGKF